MKQPTPWWMWLLPLPIVWWFALITVGVWRPGMDLMRLKEELSTALEQPWNIRWSEYSGRCLLLFSFVYAVAVGMVRSSVTATRRGEEHGSAHWGDVFGIARRYRDKRGGNLILTQHFTIGWDGYRHKHNNNVLVVGGSGAGKTRGYCVPNILEAAGRNKNAPPCSLVVTDPKSEVLRKAGALLIARGYEVRVLDLTSPTTSFCYNPLQYIQSDKDALRMIDTLIQATTPPDSKSSDPFWVKSETALLQALVLYLVHEAPEEEQNLPMVTEMLQAAEVREEDDEYESPLDMLLSRLEMRDPESVALKQYRVYKMAAGKTAKSILVSVGVRLSAFLLPEGIKMTCTDGLHLEELGEKKVALFCCIPDSEKSLNYLVGLMYGQLIQTLYYEADRKHKGRLPVPVHLLIDEAPNISLPTDSFLTSLATMRSRGIFTSYICQNMAQIKALFNKQWESLVGLCDSFLYLGVSEKETHKYVSELIGKQTISSDITNRSRGRNGSYSTSTQLSGREQTALDEVELSQRFWDMFIVDAFIGNWDRHNGNWGVLYDTMTDEITLEPVYDCGSSLYPQADDKIMESVLKEPQERDRRIFEIPTSAIQDGGKKIRYFDFISSLKNEGCNLALKRIVPKIDMLQIKTMIENTPFISELQKRFYITMLQERKTRILDFSLRELEREQRDTKKTVKRKTHDRER